MTEFDQLAEHYDETRGGERRGDEYAAEIDLELPPGDGIILEIGVGTGVVALGLRRRGRKVVGLDLSAPMLSRAMERLGPALVRSDALCMSIATASVAARGLGLGRTFRRSTEFVVSRGCQGGPSRRHVCGMRVPAAVAR